MTITHTDCSILEPHQKRCLYYGGKCYLGCHKYFSRSTYALMTDYYYANVEVSMGKCEELQLKTASHDQDNLDNFLQVWLAERWKVLTTSNIGCIAKRKATTKVNSTVKSY